MAGRKDTGDKAHLGFYFNEVIHMEKEIILYHSI